MRRSNCCFEIINESFVNVGKYYLLTGLNVRSNLLRLIRDWGGGGGMGTYVLPPARYTVTTRMALH